MGTEPAPTKRPTCPNCSKPTPICLCTRLQTPPLNNSVKVTILQHSLETKHPLNSTRIATIGLKNVDIITVSDVNFQGRFFICLRNATHHAFDKMSSRNLNAFDGDKILQMCDNDMGLSPNSELQCRGSEASDVEFTVEKRGAISSYNHCWMTRDNSEEKFDQLLKLDGAVDDIRKGFVVKKIQKKPLDGSDGFEEVEEFEIVVPSGSVLLFPSEESVDVDAVDFEVKNLIVLDGTWAKAKRMYNENPWLRFLPHVRLDIDKLSLYGEVRAQPRAGYLSTIESIVYAMKGVGEDSKGLDGLLDVFESMVGDQRRCQNERLIQAASEI